MVRQNYPSAPLTLRRRFRPSQPSLRLLWPLLTSRSSLRRRPFRHEARSPQVRTQSFPAQPPNLRRLILDHKSFAVACPLALIGNASYPVLVHRLAVSIHTSFPQSVALPQLRFTSFAVVSLREDLHLQDCAHAGRTMKKPGSPGFHICGIELILLVSHFYRKRFCRTIQQFNQRHRRIIALAESKLENT